MSAVDCPTRTYDGYDPVAFSVSLNGTRRHLTESQRAMVAARLANLGDGERADRRSANLPTSPFDDEAEQRPAPVRQSVAADLLHVSERTLRNAKAVQRDAIPDVQKAVEEGTLRVSAAAKIAKLAQEEQAEALEASHSPDLGDAGIGLLGVSELASLMDLFRGQPNVRNRRRSIPVWKTFRPSRRNLTALLRRIVFIGQPALRRLDHPLDFLTDFDRCLRGGKFVEGASIQIQHSVGFVAENFCHLHEPTGRLIAHCKLGFDPGQERPVRQPLFHPVQISADFDDVFRGAATVSAH